MPSRSALAVLAALAALAACAGAVEDYCSRPGGDWVYVVYWCDHTVTTTQYYQCSGIFFRGWRPCPATTFCTKDGINTVNPCTTTRPVTAAVCGNGVVEVGEQCDGASLGGKTCVTQGFTGGTLTCGANCQFNTAGCNNNPVCGNGAVESGEQCDGANLNGKTCATQGFASGTLACGANCQFNTAGCSMCGNGAINGNEQCDGANLNGKTCATQGFASGTVACGANCQFNTAGCSMCGNGAINGNEQCDGANLNGKTCVTQGFDAGTLACGANCQFNTAGCTSVPVCGNGIVDGAEQCDGANLNGKTCATQGFASGTLACGANCQFNTAGCNSCGNGAIDGGEQCDGANLNGKTCATQGFAGGSLACGANCQFNTAGCNSCGNGAIDGGEQCDGANLNSKTCATQGFTGGTLSCTASCTLNTASCTPQFVVMGYYPSWAQSFAPRIQWSAITDLLYFAVSPSATGGLILNDQFSYTHLQYLVSVANAQPRPVRVHVSVGGWGQSTHFAAVTADNTLRTAFVTALVNVANTYGVSINLDWEHPETTAQKNAYATLLAELAAALHPSGKMVTVAVPSDTFTVTLAAAASVDYLLLMSYDHYPAPHSSLALSTADVALYKTAGYPASKLVLGVPFYARNSAGAEAYYKDLVAQHGSAVTQATTSVGGYFFDSVNVISSKVQLAKTQGLAGMMIWELTQDVDISSSLSLMAALRAGALSTPVAVCGDGVCGASTGLESCVVCPADCGICG